MANNDTSIHNRALLVSLNMSTWTARRYDKTATDRVNADYHASRDAGRYNKFLLPGDAPSYKRLTQLASSIRVQHYANTLAWSDDGWRILPTANYMNYTAWYRDQHSAFQNAVDEFCDDYPTLKAEAKLRLNGLYREDDYPTVNEIRRKFAIDVSYQPLPAQGDIRVNLASDQIEAIEASIVARVESATQTAMTDAWQRLFDVVSHIANKLSDPDAIFRDSLIGNARELCDMLRRLNVTDDPNLEAMRSRVEALVSSVEPEELRDKENASWATANGVKPIRVQTAEKAAEIMGAMSAFYAPQA